MVLYSVLQFSSYSVLWIRANGPARKVRLRFFLDRLATLYSFLTSDGSSSAFVDSSPKRERRIFFVSSSLIQVVFVGHGDTANIGEAGSRLEIRRRVEAE